MKHLLRHEEDIFPFLFFFTCIGKLNLPKGRKNELNGKLSEEPIHCTIYTFHYFVGYLL